MSALMIALATVNPEAKMAAAYYSEGVKPLLAKYNAKPIGRYALTEQLVGEHAANVLLQVEFESVDKIKAFLDSEDYQALIPLRNEGFLSMQIYASAE